ncbi:MAG: DUF4129 domain-containing protein [Rhodopila sp.]|nr:DUF4129 domain-containing protein [Rhodopila sp.]
MPRDALKPARYSQVTRVIGRCWAAVIGMVVAIVATWRPGLLPSGAPGHRLEFHLPEWALVCIALAVGAVFVAIVATLLPAPRRKDPDDFVFELPPSPRLSPAVLIVMLLGILLAVAVAVVLLHLLGVQHPAGPAGPIGLLGAPPANIPTAPERGAVHAGAADIGLAMTVGLISAVVIGCAVLVIASNQPWDIIAEWFRPRRRRKAALVAGLASAIATGLHDLQAGDDPRQAVIACYRRCEDTLALHRRRRHPAETPREFVHDALAALRLPAPAIGSLLLVFERARFSDLPITSHDRDVAVTALGSIRATLEQRMQDDARH